MVTTGTDELLHPPKDARMLIIKKKKENSNALDKIARSMVDRAFTNAKPQIFSHSSSCAKQSQRFKRCEPYISTFLGLEFSPVKLSLG